MRVYLVRHGQTAWNAERRYQGHTDIPLDDCGLEQARLLAEAFEDRPFSRILCSDLRRAQMTAEPLATRHHVPVLTMRELRERCIGDWEALPMDQVAARFVELEILSGKSREEIEPPNGESLIDVWNRLEPVVVELEKCEKPQVVIIHGGSGGMLLAKLLRGTAQTARSFRFENGAVTMIERRLDGGFHLLLYNDSTHLRLSPQVGGGF